MITFSLPGHNNSERNLQQNIKKASGRAASEFQTSR